MTFIVEDNTGLAGANSYASDAEFKSYHKDRGNSYDAVTSEIQNALIKATDYIDRRFGLRLRGLKEFTTNDLEFPRTALYDRYGNLITGIPTRLKHATIEYAFIALTEELFLKPVTDVTGLRRTALREKVGPVETETRYAESNEVVAVNRYPIADNLMKFFLMQAGAVR